jgi:peptide/nickel transport system substrate-binding protein
MSKFMITVSAIILLLSCSPESEIGLDDIAQFQNNPALKGTVYQPGGRPWEIGVPGGTWTASINNDPKSFNTLLARDGDTGTIVGILYEPLVDYDPYKKEFIPNLAEFEIVADEKNDKLEVIFTLRDDLYWTLPGQTREQGVKVTSDDVIFWYNEVEGDRELQQPGYAGRLIDMPDGSKKPITIAKIDDRRFKFIFPRVIANPVLSVNMDFGPRYIFEPVKRQKGAAALMDLQSIDTDPKQLPSLGAFHIVSYEPGLRVVCERNPNYWKKDEKGNSLPYLQQLIFKIIPNRDTEFLIFKQKEKDAYSVRPEDLSELLSNPNAEYTVYNGGRSLGSAFVAFNQNPKTMDPVVYSWMSRKKFRQALSSLLNRERIAQTVYRGLAVPAHHFFAIANPMFDPNIQLPYTYNPERALSLLAEEGFKRDSNGVMRDPENRPVVFDIIVGIENNIGVDTMNIFSDELKQVGIEGKVKPIDFQKLVEMLTNTYDWHVATASLGSNYWPEGGSNVWQSSGNFHLWHPLQETPQTDWEKRLDELYNQGRYTLDSAKRKQIYDEFQRLILEEVPLTYIVHPLSFLAVYNRWGNIVHDTLRGTDLNYVYLLK